jgi:SnoaL-like domain
MNAAELVERYLDTWNETDADARRSAVGGVWADDGRYVDPLADVMGGDQISNLIGAVQERVPGHVFRLVDDRDGIDAHHNVVRFSWELVPVSGGEPVAVGFDVAVTNQDGRIGSLLGFLDKAPGA